MSHRDAQMFWDRMWYWEKYEKFPGEQLDDPHLVISLGRQVDSAVPAKQLPDPALVRRIDACVSRVMDRLANQLPTSRDSIDHDELKAWLKFGLSPAHRGHDGALMPIIDADRLVIFMDFCRHVRAFCMKNKLSEHLMNWTAIEATAQAVEDEHQRGEVSMRTSRFAAHH